MKLSTHNIWNEYKNELYFFILKRIQNEESAQEVLQNAFLKIHKNLHNLVQESKVRAWVYQISRNEIANFRKHNSPVLYESNINDYSIENSGNGDLFCCFDRFVEALPENYRSVILEVYRKGKTQQEAAHVLGISLANSKARIRHAKAILKDNFLQCCNYELNTRGVLSGEPDCSICE